MQSDHFDEKHLKNLKFNSIIVMLSTDRIAMPKFRFPLIEFYFGKAVIQNHDAAYNYIIKLHGKSRPRSALSVCSFRAFRGYTAARHNERKQFYEFC